ncbi:MAG: hypothetical protein L3J71_00890 [Victivallaceae bacterium]|nr:hypothetical protein [Victivallaceae bacterium]
MKHFKESMLWGIGCLFINVLGLVFVFLHWDVAKKPFLINLAGAAIMILGAILGGIGS